MSIVLTDRERLVIVTVAYGVAILAVRVLFGFVESQLGIDDLRDEQVTNAFAVIMGICWTVSVFIIVRRQASVHREIRRATRSDE